MTNTNLWGNLEDLEIVKTPKDILKEQAGFLTKATKGVLVGNVEEIDSRGIFQYDLNVEVPSLNNYVYTVLSIRHEIDLYPVHLINPSVKPPLICKNEEDFIERLGESLSSKRVKTALSRLVSQAK